jgi:hypothetical protein
MAWLFCAQAMQVLKGRGASFFFFILGFNQVMYFLEKTAVFMNLSDLIGLSYVSGHTVRRRIVDVI